MEFRDTTEGTSEGGRKPSIDGKRNSNMYLIFCMAACGVMGIKLQTVQAANHSLFRALFGFIGLPDKASAVFSILVIGCLVVFTATFLN